MGLIIVLTAAAALGMLAFTLSHPRIEEDWRDQAEGLRQDSTPHSLRTKTIAMPMLTTG